MKNPMRNFFQRVLWDKQLDKNAVKVKFLSRGVSTGIEEFTGEKIREVTRDGLLVEIKGQVKFIPFHRIVEITYRDGKTIFSKKESKYYFKI